MKGSTKLKVLAAAVAAGFGMAWLVYSCGQELEGVTTRTAREQAGSASAGAAESAGAGEPQDLATPLPERVAILSAAAVEIAFALGAGHKVVGATRFAVFPEQARSLPDLGGVMDINFERLVALKPDLIVAQTSSERLRRFATGRGMELLHIEMESVEDVLSTTRLLGARLGLANEGDSLARRIARELESIEKRVQGLGRTACFISVDRSPGRLSELLSTGGGTFITEVVELAGGRNVFDDMRVEYPSVSKEALLARDPDVILEFKPGADLLSDAARSLMADWRALAGLKAVRQGNIHVIKHEAALLPGPRIPEVALEVAEALHPEVRINGDGG